MAELFASGQIAGIIVAGMLLEFGALWLVRKRTGRGPGSLESFAVLAAGAALLLALRAALKGSTWPAIAPWMMVALVAHVGDLALRWNRTRA